MAKVPWYQATVNEGDCLYIPYLWVHHVGIYLTLILLVNVALDTGVLVWTKHGCQYLVDSFSVSLNVSNFAYINVYNVCNESLKSKCSVPCTSVVSTEHAL